VVKWLGCPWPEKDSYDDVKMTNLPIGYTNISN